MIILSKLFCSDYQNFHSNKQFIIGPMGQILAGPHFDGPCILTADLDLDEISGCKYDLDVVGHYSRPDIFHLYVNTQPMPPVVVSSGGFADPFKMEMKEHSDTSEK